MVWSRSIHYASYLSMLSTTQEIFIILLFHGHNTLTVNWGKVLVTKQRLFSFKNLLYLPKTLFGTNIFVRNFEWLHYKCLTPEAPILEFRINVQSLLPRPSDLRETYFSVPIAFKVLSSSIEAVYNHCRWMKRIAACVSGIFVSKEADVRQLPIAYVFSGYKRWNGVEKGIYGIIELLYYSIIC